VSDPVFLTGATGFIGGHVLTALLDAGHPVRGLVRPGSSWQPPVGCTAVTGDLTSSGALVRDLEGCRHLVHVAGAYSFAPRARAGLRAVNVGGCAGILEAARLAGVERAVVTSSSATVGPAHNGRLATEDDWAQPEGHSAYHSSKIEQERAALAARLPAVLILPTAPVGPADHKPTPTGAMVVAFLRGRILGHLSGGLNIVDVADVARAHVAALHRGSPRERYLVGGQNLALSELWALLASVSGRRAPKLPIPYPVAWAAGAVDELRCGVRGGEPLVPLEGVRMARHRMFIDDSRARTELGHRPSEVVPALAAAVRWYRDHGYA